ncbi:MAG: GNAT family N-acetyltransferase [Rhodobacteraceae bacterium]|nr:GNAT family N-acetyltransferase [Paracoccaceae bacterium]
MGAAQVFEVETPRLLIRPFAEGDVGPLARIGADPRVAPMMGTIPMPWPEAAVRHWIARSRFRGDIGFRLAIARRGGGLIGVAGLGGAPASLAYFLDPTEWGQGYATEAMRAFLAAVFARFRGLDVVAADHYADNPASGRVLLKLGFVRLGTGMGRSLARLEPAPNIHYRLIRETFRGQP